MAFLKKPMFVATSATFLITYPLFGHAIQPLYRDNRPREDRTVIVTGATGNLGKVITFHLAKRKVRVIMACRDLEQCKIARREIALITGHNGLACRYLDLENIESINKFADEMIVTEPHIDILINNAAVKNVPTKEITKYGIEKNYFVNFIAPFLLTFRLLGKLKESSLITRDSRVINITGTPKKSWKVDVEDINFDKRKYSPVESYRQSKLALAYFTILFNNVMREKKNSIYVYATSPCANLITRSLDMPATTLERFQALVTGWYSASCDRVVASTIRCALDPELGEPLSSGLLYTYFWRTWGWNKVVKNDHDAKLVWNSALKTLLEIPDTPPPSPADDQASNEPAAADGNRDQAIQKQ